MWFYCAEFAEYYEPFFCSDGALQYETSGFSFQQRALDALELQSEKATAVIYTRFFFGVCFSFSRQNQTVGLCCLFNLCGLNLSKLVPGEKSERESERDGEPSRLCFSSSI